MANKISEQDMARATAALGIKIKDMMGEASKNISNKDRAEILNFLKKAEKSKRDESKSLKGSAFANGGKVDFKGNF